MKEQWKLIVAIIVMIVIVFFALQNIADVEVNLFWAKFSVPLVLVMLLSVLLGAILGFISSFTTVFTTRSTTKALGKQVAELQAEVERLTTTHQEYVDQQVKFVQSKDQEIKRLGLELVAAQSKVVTAAETLTTDNGQN